MSPSSLAGSSSLARPHRWRGARILMSLGLLALSFSGCVAATPSIQPTPTATVTPCTTWRVIPSPNERAGSNLSAVSALSSTSAWAVGSSWDKGSAIPAGHSLIEQWDGSAWRIVPSQGNFLLSGVAAVSPTDVWAVGAKHTTLSGGGVIEQTLVEHWNGGAWSVVSSPSPGIAGSWLSGVAALSASDVWAVGSQSGSDGNLPLIEHWNGATWQVVAGPTLSGAVYTSLNSVARIPGTNQLWAVGTWSSGSLSTPGGPNSTALIERWDGHAWSLVAPGTVPTGAIMVDLRGVAALSPTDAWVVGTWMTNSSQENLIEHWNGATWQIVANPASTASGKPWLVNVAATGANNVRAVGYYPAGNPEMIRPVIAQWNGSSWSLDANIASIVSGGQLSAITADGAGAYWAVGGIPNQALTNTTLTLRCP